MGRPLRQCEVFEIDFAPTRQPSTPGETQHRQSELNHTSSNSSIPILTIFPLQDGRRQEAHPYRQEAYVLESRPFPFSFGLDCIAFRPIDDMNCIDGKRRKIRIQNGCDKVRRNDEPTFEDYSFKFRDRRAMFIRKAFDNIIRHDWNCRIGRTNMDYNRHQPLQPSPV